MCLYQGETPKNRAEKAQDSELAAYLENRQHYQMIQREDQETAVWNCATLYEQDVDEDADVSFLILGTLTAAPWEAWVTGRLVHRFQFVLSRNDTCQQTESEAVPKSDRNMYLIMIMAVMMETVMETVMWYTGGWSLC